MKRADLISYASNFASFLIRKKPEIRKIILFGSVASDEFDDESDIDLFIDADLNPKEVQPILGLYELSEENKKYKLEGIKNKISLKIGKLDEWKLKRSIISNGILLYGKYEEMPKGAKNFALFRIFIGNKDRKGKIRIWRRLYGYNQKVNKKTYHSKGLIKENNGKKLALGLFLIPIEKSNNMISFLKKNQLNYEVKEVFTD